MFLTLVLANRSSGTQADKETHSDQYVHHRTARLGRAHKSFPSLTKLPEITAGPKLRAGFIPQPVQATPNKWQVSSANPMPIGARYVLLCFSAARSKTVKMRTAVRNAFRGKVQTSISQQQNFRVQLVPGYLKLPILTSMNSP